LLCTAEILNGVGREALGSHCACVRLIATTVLLVDALWMGGEQLAHHRQRRLLIVTNTMNGQISVYVLLVCGLWVLFQQQLYGFKAAIVIAHVSRHVVKRQISVIVLLLCGRWVCVEDGPKD
jgi:hypothetical protein